MPRILNFYMDDSGTRAPNREPLPYNRNAREFFALALDILGLACVIDRPGYNARYREQYGHRQWHLCQTAFAIAVERAAKFARNVDRKLRVLPERTSSIDDDRLIRYYDALRTSGPPFAKTSSAQYSPLTATEFRETLHEIRFKTKASPMAQVADLYLWPIALAGYEPRNRAYVALQSSGRLIESRLSPSQLDLEGSKYSCFELVRRYRRGR